MKNMQRTILVILALMMGAKMFAQEWVYSYENDYLFDVTCLSYGDAKELVDGQVATSGSMFFRSGVGDFYTTHPAVMLLSSEGSFVAQNDFFRPGYWGSTTPYLFENDNGELFVLTSYSPDHDSTYFNYFMNYDDPPANAIIVLYKLDDKLRVVESYEHSYAIDTFENKANTFWNNMPQEHSGNIFIFSAFVDEGNIVGCYSKSSTYCPEAPREHDSIFFFRMDFNGNFLDRVGYETNGSGEVFQLFYRRYHMVKVDNGYHLFLQGSGGIVGHSPNASRQGTVFYLDEHFNILRYKQFKHYNVIPNNASNNIFYNISVSRSQQNTSYVATSARSKDDPSHDEDCRLYEYNDEYEASDPLPIVNYMERATEVWDIPAMYKAVDVSNDGSVYYAYTLNVGWYNNRDSWIMIERLDADFNTLSELYYDLGGENDEIHSEACSIIATSDGGALLVLNSYPLDNIEWYRTSIVRFSAEDFMGIKETHDNNIKVRPYYFYPNPVQNQLRMHFSPDVQPDKVELYDLQGRLVRTQSKAFESIDMSQLPAGTYTLRVTMEDGKTYSDKVVKE